MSGADQEHPAPSSSSGGSGEQAAAAAAAAAAGGNAGEQATNQPQGEKHCSIVLALRDQYSC